VLAPGRRLTGSSARKDRWVDGRARDSQWDAVVVGSGPNGLVGAVRLAEAGLRVLVVERAHQVGGGLRTEELTLPGFWHDACATVHALAGASPAFRALDLESDGLRWLHPPIPAAHALDTGSALLHRTVDETATGLGQDGDAWRRLVSPVVQRASELLPAVLDPLTRPTPRQLDALARFAVVGGLPATVSARTLLRTEGGRGLLAGMAAHAIRPLNRPATTAFGTLLAGLGHIVGWPVAEGGSQSIADALVSRLERAGGAVETGVDVTDLRDLPSTPVTLLDLSPRQVAALEGVSWPERYARAMRRYRYGPGAFKVDWAVEGDIPWRDPALAGAGTIHLGGTFDEVARSESDAARGRHSARPFVLLVQAGVADRSRAPQGKNAVWAYCHVPHGSTVDMTDAIEDQVERFAPGFRDRILARHVRGPAALEAYNPSYVGGDIASGANDLGQVITRPRLARAPWRTPVPGVYLASASTPPGAGVHGMGGWIAARTALADRT
jgi:phytoene dehydrogenase-like protein